jgi:hypothetical protein
MGDLKDRDAAVIVKVFVAGWMFVAILLLAGCQPKSELKPSPSETTTIADNGSKTSQTKGESAIPETWLGKWNGPEGTFLQVTKSANQYQVTIQNLDGPRTFEANPAGERLQFIRDGQTETIHAGNGQDAGMKWLMDKKDCLVIKKGEGFCRD